MPTFDQLVRQIQKKLVYEQNTDQSQGTTYDPQNPFNLALNKLSPSEKEIVGNILTKANKEGIPQMNTSETGAWSKYQDNLKNLLSSSLSKPATNQNKQTNSSSSTTSTTSSPDKTATDLGAPFKPSNVE